VNEIIIVKGDPIGKCTEINQIVKKCIRIK